MGAPGLNRRLVLEEAQRVPDGAGGYSESWVGLGTLWARVEPGTGREVLSGAVAQSRLRLKITVRAAPHGAPSRPRPDQRFREGARLYRILSVAAQDDGARYLTCLAEEEVAV